MYYTIYKTTNTLNGMFYIGKHKTKNPNDRYLGSGDRLIYAVRKHGRKNFKKEILYIFDNESDMNAKEAEIVNAAFCLREDTYNITTGGLGGWLGLTLSEEHRKKLSISHMGIKHCHTTPHTEESKEKMSKSASTKLWRFKSPQGEIVEIYHLTKYCKDNNLYYPAMKRAGYKIRHYRGWIGL